MAERKVCLRSPTPPPSYSEITHDTSGSSLEIPDGRWDLACTVTPGNKILSLDRNGAAVWEDVSRHDGLSKQTYTRDGFNVDLTQSAIQVTKHSYTWSCGFKSIAGSLLVSQSENLSLYNIGKQLVVFERTAEVEDRSRPPPKTFPDQKGALKVEEAAAGVFCFTGPDVYQVLGDENDLVIRSTRFVRLWDMEKKKYRWEKLSGCKISFLSAKYVVVAAGSYHLFERKNGYEYGTFTIPTYSAFISFREADQFGPEMSKGGIVLYKPCKKALYIFTMGDDTVEIQIWESTDEIRGSLVLRGDLKNLELRLIEQDPTWIRHEISVPLFKRWDPIRKYLLN